MVIMNFTQDIFVDVEVRQGELDFFLGIDVEISVLVHLCVSFLLGLSQLTHAELQLVILLDFFLDLNSWT